jgi:uncharacterized membrane protein (UPF0136 family)
MSWNMKFALFVTVFGAFIGGLIGYSTNSEEVALHVGVCAFFGAFAGGLISALALSAE